MKKVFYVILISIMLLVSICIMEISIYKVSYNKNKEESSEILKMAYNSINNINNRGKMEKEYINEIIESSSQIAKGNVNEISETDENYNNYTKTLGYKENILCNNDIIGVLVIKKLGIEAPIKYGTSQEVMKTSIGHFTESDYWNGNVSLASHNSGTSVHYFEKINNLNIDDELEYITKLGTRRYKIQSINTIKDTDWSMVTKTKSQSENTITLITCITGQPNNRLCVRGIEI